MKRRWWVAAALAVVLGVSGCGPAGALEPAASSESAAPPAAPAASPTETTEAAPSPTPTEPENVSPPQASAPLLPSLPEIPLPPTTELQVAGAPLAVGRADLYVHCTSPLTVWTGEGRAPIDEPWPPPAAYCDDSSEVLIVLLGLAAGTARAHAVVEPDTDPPQAFRAPAGQSLDDESRAALQALLGEPTAFRVSVTCVDASATITVGNYVFPCSLVSGTTQVDAGPGGALPAIVADRDVAATLWLTPLP